MPIFYRDFVYFGYEIKDFLKVAKKEPKDDPINKLRRWARVEITKKFFPYREMYHDNECDETFNEPNYDDQPQ